MKKALALIVIMSALPVFAACGAQETVKPVQPSVTPAASAPATPAPSASAPNQIDNSETGVGFMEQEYVDGNIAEIPMITYDGGQKAFEEFNWKNPEIETINIEIKTGPLQIYRDFQDGKINGGNIEIRSYPFVDDEFVQVVMSCIVFPETQPGEYTRLWSYNFNKKKNELVELDETLGQYGLTQAALAQKFKALYRPFSEDETLVEVAATGFLIDRAPAKPVTHFLLEAMLEMESDPYKSFFLYTPENGELRELNPSCLFDPEVYDMVVMDPPLAYARPELAWPEEPALQLALDINR